MLGCVGFGVAFIAPSGIWPLALAANFLPFYGLLLLAALFIAGLSRKWAPFAVVAMLLVAIGLRHASPVRLTIPEAASGDLVVMSYNAPRHPDDDSAREMVTELVERIRPDVLALQESTVWASKAKPDILRSHWKFTHAIDSLGYRADMPPRAGPPAVRWTHWRPPVLVKPGIEPQMEQFDLGSFSVLRTEFEWEGRRLALYNLHLVSHGPGKPWKKKGGWHSPAAWKKYFAQIRRGYRTRERQVRVVRELIEAEELPVVLAGDFNSAPDSWTYRQLSTGMTDAFRVAGSGFGATYHARRPVVRIDFILFGPEFEAVAAEVVTPFPSSSDHRPLVARLRWRDPEP